MSRSTVNDDPLSGLLRLKPATWQWTRAIRSALCIGLPFVFGLIINDIMTGMWIAMGCLMMITGESAGSYGSIYKTMLISAPIGALGYLLGYLGTLPWGAVVAGMMVIGFASALLSSKNRALSIGTLQTLLVASIAVGVPAIAPFWQPAVLYLVGALFYALVLGIEVLIRGWHAQDNPTETQSSQKDAKGTPGPVASNWAPAAAFSLCLGVAYCTHWVNDTAHWFWVPLTVGLVLKPDFGSIRDRALQRTIGTLAGVVIGATALATVPKGLPLVVVMSVLAGILPWAMQRSYVLQAVFLTPLVLILVDVIVPGTRDIDYGVQRLIDTAIGGVIVIIFGYLPLQYLQSRRKNP
ncbi:FUSC family protein [Chelatococcus asaccharovorans]|uniref:FUSC family protein n=1 Tax=Chelatococcus asaccharovorans TaxID=28210 RepID=UPI00224C67DB|nr:FUSC family protein [Chelatococcus asaccharovorans]CAH1672673.1 Fusaric acid resistance family protein [Chelatococcus asaccharovorans]CAH1675926.1 Fusaric acid resistance family protein [Chelatococcus asaccharovorans]